MTNNTPDYKDNLYFPEQKSKGDLTEQWKHGELPKETECYVRVNGGIYLGSIQYKNGYHNKKLPYVKSFNGQFITKYVEEVLAPVPSYDELQNMNKAVNECMAANIKLFEENAELKEQIKHLQKTQARQFVDNQKLQTKAEKAKDVVNIETARQIKELKELLKECRSAFEGHDYNVHVKMITKIDEVLR